MAEGWKAAWQIVYEPEWSLYSEFKELVAGRSERLVIGERGPYFEFLKLEVPLFTPEHDRAYYVHYRTQGRALIKVYLQKRRVDYADYRVGRYYISPFGMHTKDVRQLCRFQRAAGFTERLL